ncbi:hypothetical protein ACGFJC_26020 [Nonomuraea fuscirosea]|uniref:hypothetical protein n=1 Tax=Nonomuraea fuscirosea TaxID=1291556 RepID=UPI00341628D8
MCRELIPAGSVFAFLAEHRGTLKESEQEELARLRREKAALAKRPTGRRTFEGLERRHPSV